MAATHSLLRMSFHPALFTLVILLSICKSLVANEETIHGRDHRLPRCSGSTGAPELCLTLGEQRLRMQPAMRKAASPCRISIRVFTR